MTTNPLHKPHTWWQKLLVVCFAGLLVSKCYDLQQPEPLASGATGAAIAYSEDFNLPLARQITKDGISGCGQMEWMQSASDERLFTVRCTRDGKSWVTHVVRLQ